MNLCSRRHITFLCSIDRLNCKFNRMEGFKQLKLLNKYAGESESNENKSCIMGFVAHVSRLWSIWRG